MGRYDHPVPIAQQVFKSMDKKEREKNKVLTSKDVENDLIERAIKMGQFDPVDMPGGNRAERRMLSHRVKAEARKRGIDSV